MVERKIIDEMTSAKIGYLKSEKRFLKAIY